MSKLRTLSKLFARFCMCAGAGIVCANLAFAGVQDSRFVIGPDGTSVDFDVRETSRREVLDRLFANSGIKITWLNAASGDELISGKFSGTLSAVARRLLAQTNFVIVHEGSGEKSRVSRVLIIGQARGEQGSPILQDLSKLLFAQNKSEGPRADSSRPPTTARAVTSGGGTGTSIITVPSNTSVRVIEPVVPKGGIPVLEPVTPAGGFPVIAPVPAGSAEPRKVPVPSNAGP